MVQYHNFFILFPRERNKGKHGHAGYLKKLKLLWIVDLRNEATKLLATIVGLPSLLELRLQYSKEAISDLNLHRKVGTCMKFSIFNWLPKCSKALSLLDKNAAGCSALQ